MIGLKPLSLRPIIFLYKAQFKLFVIQSLKIFNIPPLKFTHDNAPLNYYKPLS